MFGFYIANFNNINITEKVSAAEVFLYPVTSVQKLWIEIWQSLFPSGHYFVFSFLPTKSF